LPEPPVAATPVDDAPVALPSRRRVWPLFVLGLLVVVPVGAYFAMRQPAEQPPPVAVTPPTPVETVDAGPPVPMKLDLTPPEKVAPAPPPPVVEEPVAPTLAALKARLTKDEQLAKKKRLSSKVRAKLSGYRKALASADQPAERLKLQTSLENFERTYLGKK
jgi:hypothetical protein